MSRHAGLRPWLLQRLSAVYLGVYTVYLFWHFALHAPTDFIAWQGWVASSTVSVSAALFFLALLLHVWVGLRDVLMDYVRNTTWRVIGSALLLLTLSAWGLWALRILARVGYA